MSAIEVALDRWRAEAIALNPGASEGQLASLQARVRAELPADVRQYFAAVNGMVDGENVGDMITHFWSIEEIVARPYIVEGKDAQGQFRDIAFADVMIEAWFIRMRVRGALLSIFVETVDLEFPSLEAFFSRYLEDIAALCI